MEVIDVGSADAQRLGMKPITFVRQVLALCIHPELLNDETFPVDVQQRARELLEHCAGGSVGSYAESAGIAHVQQSVAKFITRRDKGLTSDPSHIFMSSGSQRALRCVLKFLLQGSDHAPIGVMTPNPHPHTLLPLLELLGIVSLPYQLQQGAGWALEKAELKRALQANRGNCNPRAIYISNPGDPTGHVQDRESIQDVIQFAAEENLLLLVNEVFQDSVFGDGCEFLSYKKVLFEMGSAYSERVQLASFHSLSNGIMGECGFRAGYVELVNFDALLPYVETELCGSVCAPVIGQIALDVMVDPPQPGEPSFNEYCEVTVNKDTLKRNVLRGRSFLNSLPGFSCPTVTGGVYLYTHLTLPQMESDNVELLYSSRLLVEEGVCVGVEKCVCTSVPGENSCHIRICVLMPSPALEEVLSRLETFHLRFLNQRS
ncbi:alanine aminotransferase 2 isoform X2 [Denticeps clupeoides]|uniref:alanine aminotransferase 2 isoform X2 n=1 Tax=Denticeps clupeoides TaxID=299321 RepID=UPI0010A31173|nr:alanine aminotransferase 2-like isoform X2 [Denticeps clupeoides]